MKKFNEYFWSNQFYDRFIKNDYLRFFLAYRHFMPLPLSLNLSKVSDYSHIQLL